eukprot:1261359-Rhodomonas_salina.1
MSMTDALEPDPANWKEAMRHERFREFWLDAERTEWKGLWDRGCFKKWRREDLKPDDCETHNLSVLAPHDSVT